jgi:hypothetical protein
MSSVPISVTFVHKNEQCPHFGYEMSSVPISVIPISVTHFGYPTEGRAERRRRRRGYSNNATSWRKPL